MAPVPSTESLALTGSLLPPLWLLISASLSSTRSRFTAPLILFSLLLAFQPLFLHHSPTLKDELSLSPVVRQVPPPDTSPVPTGPLAGSPSPSPLPSASPLPETVLAPVQQFPPEDTENNDVLTLDQCSGGLQRMQVVILLELCFEILFLFMRCFADQEETGNDPPVDVTMRGYIFLRAIYLVPVLVLNASIYWVGGGPTGSCLSNFSAVQVPFVHLIFYIFYCIIIVIIGIYRIDEYDDKTTSYYDTSSSAYPSTGPPTRTTSYFRGYGRRHRTSSDSTSYDEPKFRVNLGCCRLNF